MDVSLNIEFDQLVKLVKQLPASQWNKLKHEVEMEANSSNSDFLFTGSHLNLTHKKEIDNRIDHYIEHPDDLLEWEEVEKNLLARNPK